MPETTKTTDQWFSRYARRWMPTSTRPPRPTAGKILRTAIAAFIGIATIALVTRLVHAGKHPDLFLVASFGAMAMLVYVAPQSDFSQPRNVIGGNMLSAAAGVTMHYLLPNNVILAAASAVAVAAILMQATRTVNPPAGSTALIPVIGDSTVHHLGYLFVLTPVGLGAAVLVLVAMVVNNLFSDPTHHYPTYWW